MKPRWQKEVATFLFEGEGDRSITALRIGLGLHITVYCFALRPEWVVLFGTTGDGLLSRRLAEMIITAESPVIPHLGWMVELADRLGFSQNAALMFAWWALLVAGLLLTVGFFCRTSAIVAWFLHLSAAKSGGLLSYGVDNLTTIGLFYLMCAPFPDTLALDSRWRKGALDAALVSFLRRILQLHLCIIYFFGGLTKSLGSGWWDGINLWRALTREPFDVIPMGTLASIAGLLPVLGFCVWIIELAYPVLIWPSRTRTVWLTLTCALHVGIGLAMGMYLFAFVMIVLNVAAFGFPSRSRVVSDSRTVPVGG